MAMYKIIAAINSMISNQQLITDTLKQEKEIFFLYEEKFKWSIVKADDGHFYLHYYPGEETLKSLSSLQQLEWARMDYITYSTKELKTKEALESFSELYQIVQNKVYGIDEVLDYIINTAA